MHSVRDFPGGIMIKSFLHVSRRFIRVLLSSLLGAGVVIIVFAVAGPELALGSEQVLQ